MSEISRNIILSEKKSPCGHAPQHRTGVGNPGLSLVLVENGLTIFVELGNLDKQNVVEFGESRVKFPGEVLSQKRLLTKRYGQCRITLTANTHIWEVCHESMIGVEILPGFSLISCK
jgi:hypothetical protein